MAPGRDRGEGNFLQQQEASHKTLGFAAWAWPTKHRTLLFVIQIQIQAVSRELLSFFHWTLLVPVLSELLYSCV